MSMHRLAALVGTLVLAALLAAPTGAAPPLSASGTVTVVDLSITPLGQSGSTESYHIVSVSTLDGDFSGTLTSDSVEVLNPTGNSTIQGTETCICTVAGRSGTVVFRQVAKITGDPFLYEDTKTVISATGRLAGLHATLAVVWDGGVATYTGAYHFDP
jgi:Protein of unknown function (DUF3224)